MKRLVICSDGTWQSERSKYPTNIAKIAQAVRTSDSTGTQQIVYYDSGVGTRSKRDRVGGGAFGWGLDQAIKHAYRFLALNWEQGDEIYLFGFSRGAYTVRSLAGLLNCCGLVSREHLRQVPVAMDLYRAREIEPSDPKSKNFRRSFSKEVQVTALCCFDTVGSLGIPDLVPFLPFDNMLNAKYQFHDTELSGIIANAFHAVAIDERRKVFGVTKMDQSRRNPNQSIKEMWFVGDHGCVGGGSAEKAALSNLTLGWLISEIESASLGLSFDPTKIQGGTKGNVLASFNEDRGFLDFAGRRWREIEGGVAALHATVKRRWQGTPGYRPKNLEGFASSLNARR